jgi:hypothetical protein
MTYRIAFPLLALLVAAGCTGTDATSPGGVAAPGSVVGASSSGGQASARTGPLNVEKDCSTYTAHAGEICTITKSNLKAIEVGSTITYASDAVNGFLDTDIVLDPPGPGNNRAFGHCTLSLVTGVGECRLTGGTGKFTWLDARVDVSPLGWPNFAWEGTYSFGNEGGED